MATRQPAQRRDDEPAFVLHAYPYRETSLIVEAFTPNYGRVGMVARGARRPRSETRGLLQAFQPLTLSWAGTGELKTLMKAEWRGGMPLPGGSALLAGFYVNELLMKLLPREDAHPALFDEYAAALAALTERPVPAEQAAVLRRFEVRLLAELGYALAAGARRRVRRRRSRAQGITITCRPRAEAATRRTRRTSPPCAVAPRARRHADRADDQVSPTPTSRSEAKRLMREVLDHHLEERRIFSRRVVRDLRHWTRKDRHRDRTGCEHRPCGDAPAGAAHVRTGSGVGRRRGAPGRRGRHHRPPARRPAPHPGRRRATAARPRAHQAQPGDGGHQRNDRRSRAR